MADPDTRVIVIDHGTSCCRVSFESDHDPIVIPTASKSGTSPIEKGLITNWEEMERIWHHILHEKLKVNPEDHPILLTESLVNTPECRKRMLKIFFEKLNVPAVYIANRAVLALFSMGKTSGTVVTSGEGVTSVVPVVDGMAQRKAVKHVEVAGGDVTSYLQRLLSKNNQAVTMEIARDIKETLAYVSINYDEEKAKVESYSQPGGGAIKIGDERFQCAEALFKPALCGFKGDAIQQAVLKSIKECDSGVSSKLSSVFLTGGGTLIRGLEERLGRELEKEGMKCTVNAKEHRGFAAWAGGAIFASMPNFKPMSVTKKEYQEVGPDIIRKFY